MRELIQWQRSGKPDCGALESLTFTGVDPQGDDVYRAVFDHGSLEFHMSMAPDGKIAAAVAVSTPAQTN